MQGKESWTVTVPTAYMVNRFAFQIHVFTPEKGNSSIYQGVKEVNNSLPCQFCIARQMYFWEFLPKQSSTCTKVLARACLCCPRPAEDTEGTDLQVVPPR